MLTLAGTLPVRLAVSLGLLGLLWLHADGPQVVERLLRLQPEFVLMALAVTVPQVALSAWRWHFTASRLRLHLPFGDAFREYYLAQFLNQILPGGVAGDVARAWRHGRMSEAGLGAAARAVILERTSGQVALFAVVIFGLMFAHESLGDMRQAIGFWAPVAGLAVLLVSFALYRFRHKAEIAVFLADSKRVFSGRAGALQLLSSFCVVATYLLVYDLAGRAVGVDLPLAVLLTIVPVILFSMVLPVSISGWGVRESVAVALASSAGLTPETAIAVSIAYGLIVLLSSLPGLLIALMLRTAAGTRTSATSGR